MWVKYTGVQEPLHKGLSPVLVVLCCIAVRKDLTLQEVISLDRWNETYKATNSAKKKNKEVECLFQEGHENKIPMSTTKELLNSCYYEKNASIVRG